MFDPKSQVASAAKEGLTRRGENKSDSELKALLNKHRSVTINYGSGKSDEGGRITDRGRLR